MAWRPYENLIQGELSNRIPGKVTGWMRFLRRGKKPLEATFDLTGDFHEDIRGKVIRLKNETPSDRNEELGRDGSYVEGLARVQRGTVGDITAGLPLGPWTEELAHKLIAQNELIWDENGIHGAEREERRQEFAERYRKHIEAGDLYYAYSSYPYIEFYSEKNGRVVLELDPSQVEVLDIQGVTPRREKSPRELLQDQRKRERAMVGFLSGMLKTSPKRTASKAETATSPALWSGEVQPGHAPRRVSGQSSPSARPESMFERIWTTPNQEDPVSILGGAPSKNPTKEDVPCRISQQG